MLLSLQVNDNKSQVFLDFLKGLDFVKIERFELNDEAHSNLVNERLEEYNSDPDSGEDLMEVLEALKVKYGF